MRRTCTLAVTAVAAAAPGGACTDEAHGCPRVPCPSPPPGYQTYCDIEPNPLVINEAGLCCHESPCQPLHCFSSDVACGSDGAGSFVFTDDGTHAYDCSRSASARSCLQSIADEDEPVGDLCSCVVHDCLVSTDRFRSQDSQCVLTCRDPQKTGSGICPNWDDNVGFCLYYAAFFCAATYGDPSDFNPPPTACEERCLQHPPPGTNFTSRSPEDDLDRFLRCFVDCTESQHRLMK